MTISNRQYTVCNISNVHCRGLSRLAGERPLNLNMTRGVHLDSLRADLKAAERTRRRRARHEPPENTNCYHQVADSMHTLRGRFECKNMSQLSPKTPRTLILVIHIDIELNDGDN